MNKKLSVIGVVRNDDYGMYLKERLTCFFKSIQECEYDIELILTEWNPPSDRKSFYEEYKNILPTNKKIKIVTVPNEIHNSLQNSHLFPVFEYIGKNVAARHATGDYLLFTNPDNIFVKDLWDEIFENIDDDHFLRAARSDIFFKHIDFESLNIQEILKKLPTKQTHWYNNSGELFGNASGDFLCVERNNFLKICGYDELYTYSHIDSLGLFKLRKSGIKQKVLTNVTYHIDHLRPHILTMVANNVETRGRIKHTFNDNWGLSDKDLVISEY